MIKVLRYKKELEGMFDEECSYGYDLVLANKIARFGITREEAERHKSLFEGQSVETIIDEKLGGEEYCLNYPTNFNYKTLFLTRKKAERRYIAHRWREDRAKHKDLKLFLKELAEEALDE